jgi:isoquinoline 1-oxidoreductase beta subunit
MSGGRGGSLMRLRGLVRKEFLQIVRDPSSIAIAFLMPVFLLTLFGYGVSLDADHVPVALVADAPSADSDDFMASLQGTHYFAPRVAHSMAEAEEALRRDEVKGIVRLPADFSRRLRQADGAPVQTFWSREQDTRHDLYRPACVSRFKAGFDSQGNLVAWRNSSAGQAIVPQVLGRLWGLPGAGPDKTAAEGAFDQPYEFPNARVGHEIVSLPLQVGFWRAVGHSHQAFFKEGFMDEAAAAAGRDPVAFRAALLKNHPRHLAVLQRAARLAGWDQPLPASSDGRVRGRGVAVHQSFGAIVAQVAEVSVDKNKRIRVERVFCAVDCGFVVNPNIVRQQIESAIVYGLSAALYGEVTIDKGQVQQGNFHDYPALRIDECPVIETAIIDSAEHPEGIGEPGLPPIAPAVANAVFAATGQRLRALPLKLA